MAGLGIMLPIALIIALIFLGFFFWSVRNGDYEDGEMIAHRILHDSQDDVALPENPAPNPTDKTPPATDKPGV